MTAIRSIDRVVRARHLLKHPFYTAWSKGEVPLPTLQRYAEQYYQFESNFPRFVAGVYARLSDPADRKVMLENLIDEAGRHPTHPELWLDFAESIDVPRTRVLRASPTPATRRLLTMYEQAAVQGSAAAGLGALYAYESIFPEVAAEKSRGLREEYGIRGSKAHEFFRVHTVADVEHGRAERGVMGRMARTSPRNAKEMLSSARRSVDAWWGFLDAFTAAQ